MPQPGRPGPAILRTVAAVSSATGLYALAVAAFTPAYLVASVPGIGVGRTDTTGLVAIVVSAASVAGLRLLACGPSPLARTRELLRVVAAYAGVGWAYLALNTLTHPATRYLHATHLASVPTEGQLAAVCLVVAAVALLVSGLLGGAAVSGGGDGDRPTAGPRTRRRPGPG